jgi:hypothetical protein
MLKIFELHLSIVDEKEWIAAHSIIEALQTYQSVTGTTLQELDREDEITEVPESKWDEYTLTNSDHDPNDPESLPELTFRQLLQGRSTPDILGGTSYE